MSGGTHIKRAVAAFITDVIPEVHAFSSVLANTEKLYPQLLVTEINSDSEPLGCGFYSHLVRDSLGKVVARGRLIEKVHVLRLTLTAPNDATTSGAQIVQELTDRIEQLLTATNYEMQLYRIVDPATNVDQKVTALRVLSAKDLEPVITGEPFLFRRVMSIRLTCQYSHQEVVENTIDRVHIGNGENRD